MRTPNTQRTKKSRTSHETNADDKDFISKLPESVISRIFSRIPAKICVQTSVLSKDWRNKWTSIYNIAVRDDHVQQVHDQALRNNLPSFVTFMNKLLNHTHNVRRFTLFCKDKYDANVITGWISAESLHNVELFHLMIHDEAGFVLPCHILNNTVLERLILKCAFRVPCENYFPKLTYLCLEEVEIQNGNPSVKGGPSTDSRRLAFTFPVLKTLELRRCRWSNVDIIEIHSPALSIFICQSSRLWDARFDTYSLKIRGARLLKFENSGYHLPKTNIDLDDSIVLNAYLLNTLIEHGHGDGSQIRQLLKGFSEMKCLQLSAWMCEAIADNERIQLPRYDKLQRLTLYVQHAEFLFELLHSAPSLKFLEIDKVSPAFVCFKKVDSVPYCLTTNLEQVVIRDAERKVTIHLAMFMLRTGAALKKLHIFGNYRSGEDYIMKRISSSRRASACVEIRFFRSRRDSDTTSLNMRF